MNTPGGRHLAEFVALVTALTSIIAMGTDLMLTSLDEIGRDLGAWDANAPQLVIPIFILGTGLGQLVSGPASDFLGRKPVIVAGLVVFLIGNIVCALAQSFEAMLWGRLIQGLGTSAPRTVTMAMVRDLYAGRAMAQVTSFVMGVFVLIPALAPSLGQWIAETAGWRSLFVFFVALGVVAGLWLVLRQAETHPPARRKPFRPRQLAINAREAATHMSVLRYSMIASLMFGAFFAFLGTAPQIYEDAFAQGDRFTTYFAFLAISLALAAVTNAKLVGRVGMRRMVLFALTGCFVLSAVYLVVCLTTELGSSVNLFVAWCVSYFFFQGLMMGNINALALEPMEHIAGMAQAVFGALSTTLAVIIAIGIGETYGGTPMPILIGFTAAAFGALLLILPDKGES